MIVQFDPAERSVDSEKKSALALISKLDHQSKKPKITPEGGTGDVLNVRKAVRYASKGKGGVALAQDRLEEAKRVKEIQVDFLRTHLKSFTLVVFIFIS